MKLPRFLSVTALVLAVGAFTALAASPATHVEAAPATFEVDLSGANEVPPVQGPANGLARLTFDGDTNELTWAIFVRGISGGAVTAAHIHLAAAGSNGPVIVPISGGPFAAIDGSATLTDEQVVDLKAGNLYINVHSMENPGGVVRGQLSLPEAPAPASVTPPSTGDAGLAGQANHRLGALTIVIAMASLVVVLASLSVGAVRRRI